MEPTDRLRLWHWGLIGGTTLGMLTSPAMVVALFAQPVAWREVLLPPALFGIGFVCGSVVGWLRFLSDEFGWVGDANIGAVVGTLFFALCAVLDGSGGGGLVVVGTVLGAAVGIIYGWDWRRDAAREAKAWRKLTTPATQFPSQPSS